MDRTLGTFDAVVIGLAAMIGAGVFVVFAPAAAAAGTGLMFGLAIAAFVAYCNATSSAQLAARYPTSGGTYVYGREQLGPWWGFIAGWSFVIGKIASCGAMALTFATYVVPEPYRKPVAVALVVLLVAVNYRGVTRTAQMARVIVAMSVTAIGVGLCVSLWGPGAHRAMPDVVFGSWYGVLQSAGLLFFAFAGYARIATLGEEVRDPRRTIPRAILIALGAAVVIYALVAVVLLVTLGQERLAESTRPLADAVALSGWGWAEPIVVVGAAVASAGALLALIAGVSRTAMAMGRERDLPPTFAAIHPKFSVPHHAELVVGAIVIALVSMVDLRGVIGFSSFGVLVYYLVANVSAYTQDGADRMFPRWLQVVGALGCAVLAFTLPTSAVAAGTGVVLLGCGYRWIRLKKFGDT
ncbi:amino acid permease [Rhodococcus sp. AD45-ID]|uniref:APC family permease n=1 Tax=Rhodococcus TaxID=1827 RepID=UPI0005D45736|nr:MULTISPECIES: APC family permease [Rhodococcus]KJF21429.1 Low-affinity putrescine importer PlaP [Rhodococcus sp. AD45]MCE4262961.1 amino acid permease [Rhodococcus globerulus]PSR38915.1 amino acid permease [Rhodococcus sp. AD45-ID]